MEYQTLQVMKVEWITVLVGCITHVMMGLFITVHRRTVHEGTEGE